MIHLECDSYYPPPPQPGSGKVEARGLRKENRSKMVELGVRKEGMAADD